MDTLLQCSWLFFKTSSVLGGETRGLVLVFFVLLHDLGPAARPTSEEARELSLQVSPIEVENPECGERQKRLAVWSALTHCVKGIKKSLGCRFAHDSSSNTAVALGFRNFLNW